MIQARNDRDHLNIKFRDLRKMVFATVDEALELSMLQIILPKPEEASAIGVFKKDANGDT